MTTQSIISLATADGLFFLKSEDIVRLEASRNYTRIYFTNNSKILSAKVLKEFAAMLEPMGFVRTHRTHLVNRQHISCVTAGSKIIMNDASVASISRRMRSAVMKELRSAA